MERKRGYKGEGRGERRWRKRGNGEENGDGKKEEVMNENKAVGREYEKKGR